MTSETTRNAPRISYAARALLRGVCGLFEAIAEDISLTGVRVVLARDELKLDPHADLAGAAACVQTRLGSRFVIELGLTAAGRGRVRKTVELVRLAVEPDHLEVGCCFVEPLTQAEIQGLKLELAVTGEPDEPVRQASGFADGDRATLDPDLGREKVERLFDVPAGERPGRHERLPIRSLRAMIRGGDAARGAPPLLGAAAKLTAATVWMRIPFGELQSWGVEPGDLPAVARGLLEDYGPWPMLEILDENQRRLWHGPAHVCGLDVTDATSDVTLRLAFSRRLQPAELDRLCA